jgi:hypothetical protein
MVLPLTPLLQPTEGDWSCQTQQGHKAYSWSTSPPHLHPLPAVKWLCFTVSGDGDKDWEGAMFTEPWCFDFHAAYWRGAKGIWHTAWTLWCEVALYACVTCLEHHCRRALGTSCCWSVWPQFGTTFGSWFLLWRKRCEVTCRVSGPEYLAVFQIELAPGSLQQLSSRGAPWGPPHLPAHAD